MSRKYLGVPEMSRKVVCSVPKLQGQDFMHDLQGTDRKYNESWGLINITETISL